MLLLYPSGSDRQAASVRPAERKAAAPMLPAVHSHPVGMFDIPQFLCALALILFAHCALAADPPLVPEPANLPITDTNKWLIAATYFWDNDPGASHGTNVNISAGESVTLGFP